MQKLISLLLVLATVLSFVACGKFDSEGSDTGTASGDNTATSALTSVGTESGIGGEPPGTDKNTDGEGTETEGTGTEGTGTDETDTSDGTEASTESDKENAVDNSQSETGKDDKDADSSGKKNDEDTTKASGSSTKKPSASTQKPASTSGGTSSNKAPSSTSSNSASATKPATTTTNNTPVSTTKPAVTTKTPSTTTGSGSSTPVVKPSAPAPSYPLKGSTPTDPNADYNTQQIGIAALREGAGPLTENGIYIGKNDFMFIGETMDDYTGTNLWSDRKVQKFVDMMNDRSAWANENGIKFYFVIAPNKATVYGDYVPTSVTPANYTLCDQVVDALNANGTIEVVDLRGTMKSARAIYGDTLYYKYDTHWNNHGGFVAYTEIMNRISADVKGTVTYSVGDFDIRYYETYMKDMPFLLGFYDKYYDEGPVYSLKNGPDATLVTRITDSHNQGEFEFAYEWPNGYRDNLVYCEFNSKNTSAPDLYMYRDSFGIALVPFMKESFSNSSFEWDRAFYRSEILNSGADVVVIEVVEKYLSEILKFKTFSD